MFRSRQSNHERKIEQLAKILSDNYHFISSEQRKQLHLAGVFACNFTNAMYRIAKEIVEKTEWIFYFISTDRRNRS